MTDSLLQTPDSLHSEEAHDPPQLSSFEDNAVDFPYKSVSRGAIVSLVLVVLALPGLVSEFSPMLVMGLVGIFAGLLALMGIRRYPNEYSGKAIAITGMILNLALVVGGTAMHVYIYYTEVPDGYTRVQFYDLQQEPNVEQRPTEKALAMNGEDVFLKGYIHPSSGSGLLKHFILVPDLGTCCFGGQPASSDMIEITLTGGQTTKANLRKKKLAGKFRVNLPQKISDFDSAVFYRMRADDVK